MFVIAALMLLAVVAIAPLSAVMFGQPDGNGHPYVGLAVFYDSNKVPLWRCSGALISSTILLTAAHCTGLDLALGFAPSSAQVWFDAGPIAADLSWTQGTSCNAHLFTGYPCVGGQWGTPFAHPAWNGHLPLQSNTHDVGVVVLDDSISISPLGQLAPAGYLDALATKRGQQDVKFTVVGYGLQSVKPVLSGLRERFVGTVMLINLRSALTDGSNIQYSDNPGLGTGPGGTCFGDSGGPVLHTNEQGQDVIVGVNSFVLNQNCKGTAFAHRVDIADSRNFLTNYVTLP